MLAVLRASAVMPPRAGCCSVLRSTLRVAQLARGGLPRAHCRQVQSQPTTPAPDGTGSRQGAHNTPTFADPSRAPLPADTSVFVGTAFPRALAFDNSAAQLLATEMVGDLTDFAEKLRRLQLMCWDAGGAASVRRVRAPEEPFVPGRRWGQDQDRAPWLWVQH